MFIKAKNKMSHLCLKTTSDHSERLTRSTGDCRFGRNMSCTPRVPAMTGRVPLMRSRRQNHPHSKYALSPLLLLLCLRLWYVGINAPSCGSGLPAGILFSWEYHEQPRTEENGHGSSPDCLGSYGGPASLSYGQNKLNFRCPSECFTCTAS